MATTVKLTDNVKGWLFLPKEIKLINPAHIASIEHCEHEGFCIFLAIGVDSGEKKRSLTHADDWLIRYAPCHEEDQAAIMKWAFGGDYPFPDSNRPQ